MNLVSRYEFMYTFMHLCYTSISIYATFQNCIIQSYTIIFFVQTRAVPLLEMDAFLLSHIVKGDHQLIYIN